MVISDKSNSISSQSREHRNIFVWSSRQQRRGMKPLAEPGSGWVVICLGCLRWGDSEERKQEQDDVTTSRFTLGLCSGAVFTPLLPPWDHPITFEAEWWLVTVQTLGQAWIYRERPVILLVAKSLHHTWQSSSSSNVISVDISCLLWPFVVR